MKNVKIDFLKNTPLFSSLTDEELLEISSRVIVKEFSKNEAILREEDTNAFMYIILVGKAKVVQTTDEGKEIILAIHTADDFFGEISLIDGRTSPATVIATEDSLLAIISRQDFYSLLSIQSKVLEKLLQILCSRLRDSWKLIEILNRKGASQRIRMLFLTLSHTRGERTEEGMILQMKLTHQDIADMSGLTRETVTKVLHQWKKDGEITFLKNRCIRLNPGFLREGMDVI